MRLLLANPRGFCAGVDRAIAVVEDLLEVANETVYVRHAIVHNNFVVKDLSRRGAIFVENIEDIPPGSLTVLSAHGSPPQVRKQAATRRLRVIDATCPLVQKVQLQVLRFARQGRDVIVIGHRDHVEVAGLVGQLSHGVEARAYVVENEDEAASLIVRDPGRLGYVTQTTLSVSETARIVARLRDRFPRLALPPADTICYATQNRQDAVRTLAESADLIIVVGAPHSSNSRRLVEVAKECGIEAYLVEGPVDVKPEWFNGVETLGLTSSASAPESLIKAITTRLGDIVPILESREIGRRESVAFNAPRELKIFKMEKPMRTEPEAETKANEFPPLRGVGDVLDAAVNLADQVRKTGVEAARLGAREVEMLVGIGEDLRDRGVKSELLSEARELAVMQELRSSTHRAVDIGFDVVSVGIRLGVDAIDVFLRAPRQQDSSLATGPVVVE